MNSIGRLLSWIYTVWFGLVFVVLMILFTPLFLVSALFGTRANLVGATTLMLIWFRIVCILTFMRTRIVGRAKAKAAGPCVWVGNHSSFLDAIIVKLALQYGFLPLGKKEQAKTPILGLIYSRNVILIDRSSEASRKESMDIMRRYMEEGYSILIFPEGTMNRTEWLVKPFYDGAFRLAIEMQKPICPFAVVGARQLMPRGSLRVTPGLMQVHFCDPIPTTGMTLDDIPRLRQMAYEAIYRMMDLHSGPDFIGKGKPMPLFDSADKEKLTDGKPSKATSAA